ncbi:recombinase family protein [Arthrobacter sp. SLBN-122]|uniref:recombinase family protein n=1 Tax=Arthrobacter sp. SLBN-122 TaxID=2768455 RepID=UPI0011527F7C|nr:recombinase family protein [Arthrobacter sp. SLBN-122]TQJ33057.1 DNA invertase Pin-like site-specific DNA recombinase [Arthrobacter sp. SLBN-122]
MGLLGYARVSTFEQNLDLQLDALKEAGCVKIYSDKGISGAKAERPGLDEMLRNLRPGDTIVVWKLDRIARNTLNLLTLVEKLDAEGCAFRSLTDGISTDGPMGRAFLTIASAFSTLERDQNIARTSAGLAAARARGRVGGRKPSLTVGQAQQVKALYEAKMSVTSIAATMGVSRQTIYRYLELQNESVSI